MTDGPQMQNVFEAGDFEWHFVSLVGIHLKYKSVHH